MYVQYVKYVGILLPCVFLEELLTFHTHLVQEEDRTAREGEWTDGDARIGEGKGGMGMRKAVLSLF